MGLTDVQVGILISSTVYLSVSTFVVCLRLYDRRYNKKLSFAIDDYAVIASLVFIMLWTISTIIWVSCYYMGVDGALTMAQYRPVQINSYINRILYAIGFDLAKVSIMLFYLKLTGRFTQRLYWLVLNLILGFMVFDLVFHFLVLAVPCTPVSNFWTSAGMDHCWSVKSSARVINGFTFTSEVLIVLAPIPMLWLAGLDIRQRVALGCMFSLGILIILASALKLRNVLDAGISQPLYNIGIAYIWIGVECNTALLVAGFLPLKALLEARFKAVKRRFSSPDTSSSQSQSDEKRNNCLVPADPYDLSLIATLEVTTTPAHQAAIVPNEIHHTALEPQISPKSRHETCGENFV